MTDKRTRTPVTETMIADFVRRRDMGKSYLAISRDYGLDPRTVKAHVIRAGNRKRQDHWESVRRDVDAKYLHDHYRLLMQAVVAVGAAVGVDPLDRPETFSTSQHLLEAVASSLTELGPIKVALMPRKVLEALAEHEPGLWKAVSEWEAAWKRVHEARIALAARAEGLLRQNQLPDELARAVRMDLAQEALNTAFEGRRPRIRNPDEDISAGRAYEYVSGEGKDAAWKTLRLSQEDASLLKTAFTAVLKQLCIESIVQPSREARRQCVACAQRTEDLVGDLVLRGKPAGECRLCPR